MKFLILSSECHRPVRGSFALIALFGPHSVGTYVREGSRTSRIPEYVSKQAGVHRATRDHSKYLQIFHVFFHIILYNIWKCYEYNDI